MKGDAANLIFIWYLGEGEWHGGGIWMVERGFIPPALSILGLVLGLVLGRECMMSIAYSHRISISAPSMSALRAEEPNFNDLPDLVVLLKVDR